MTSDQREQAIEHLLRRAPDDTVPVGVCLDGETAAAWVEGRLPKSDVERARVHLADCARCQALMASIAAATPADAQVEREPGWRHWLRWAAPAAAGAVAIVAVAVWLNVRATPTSMPQSVTLDEAREARQTQPTNAVPPAKANPEPKGLVDGRGPADRPAFSSAKLPPTASRESVAPAPAPPPPAPAQVDRLDRLEAANAAAAGAAVAAQPPASADQKAGAASREPRVMAALEQPVARPFALRQFVSPDPSVRWRLAGDHVERSTDGGTNWTAATRLDSGAILAGSAPSPLDCWLAGRAGVVFLATDGLTFRQVTSPAAIDLVAISAIDASSAMVTASDGRRFTTTDGGSSWSPVAAR